MNRSAGRWRLARPSWIGRLPEIAGTASRSLIRTVPGAVGAVLIAFGLGEIYRPLFWLAVGAALLLVDRRVQ